MDRLSKLDAARRQVDTAIELNFEGRDLVSVWTLAAAAYNILRDLMEKAGRRTMTLKQRLPRCCQARKRMSTVGGLLQSRTSSSMPTGTLMRPWHSNLSVSSSTCSLDRAYARGVPMGGDLRALNVGGAGAGDGAADESGRIEAAAPSFLIWALKDPTSASLDRMQVIKGWVAEGGSKEVVYDVACADGRVPAATTRRCPATPATVGADCAPSSGHGAAELATRWTDPDFDPARRAFYYVRVLENPTCRWSTWNALGAGAEPPPSRPRTVQERAWSSPIWYSPRPRRDAFIGE
jgi:hypothetical protein